MNRPRTDQIEPMVPELETATYRADGGHSVASRSDSTREHETGAPLVPDVS
jgi:hypothetical protein